MSYVDVHTHLFHEKFNGEGDDAARRAADAGVEVIIVNGLEPRTNRETLAMASRHDHVFAAIGVYPVDASVAAIDADNWAHGWGPPTHFDVDAEIDWIADNLHLAVAIGECGLDRHWVDDEAVRAEQERVLRRLCVLSNETGKPLILHTRKAEQRTFEILQEERVVKADFHCFSGKSVLGAKIAEAGYYLSIPPIIERSKSFQSLARSVPLDRLLTETDAPYMSADRGQRNEPANVVRGVAAIAAARGESIEVVRDAIRANTHALFGV